MSKYRSGKGADAQQSRVEGRPVRTNGSTFMGDDWINTPVNNVVSKRNDGSGDFAMEEASSDSDDELPLPSSIHSMRSYEDSPPKGLLYSSPSGRRIKKTEKQKKEKRFVAVGSEKSPSEEHPLSAMGETERAQPVTQTKTDAEGDNARNCIRPVTSAIVVEDNVKEKTEEIARLQRRVAGLKDDVWALQQQIDFNQSGKGESKVDANNLLDIVLRYLGEEELCNQPATPSIPLSKSLTSFLPFAKPLRPTTPPPKARPPSFPVTSCRSNKAKYSDDPTPYLQFFTPLDFTRTISRDTETESAVSTSVQLHTITFRSPGNLLEGTMHVNYDTATETIIRIRLLKISKWADRELGSWIRRKISDDDNEEDRCNINVITWAIGRYWDFALSRAQCWLRCEKAHAEIVGRWAGTAVSPSGPSRQRKNGNDTNEEQRNEYSDIEDEPDKDENATASNDEQLINELADMFHLSKDCESPTDTAADIDTDICANAGADIGIGLGTSTGTGIGTGIDSGTHITNHEPSDDAISSHLGRQLLKLHGNGGDVELFVDYRIEFDWTGEVQSVVHADLAIPGPWREIDERDALGKVPILFHHLKKHSGVYNAVRVLLKLIYT